MIYLDASALVTLVAGRQHAQELQEFLAARPGMPMATSTVGFIETTRTLDQIGDYPTVMEDLVQQITEILLTEEVRDAAASVPGRVRTLDAIHIASAQVIGEDLEALVTYDKRMYDAAHGLGLFPLAPGFLDGSEEAAGTEVSEPINPNSPEH